MWEILLEPADGVAGTSQVTDIVVSATGCFPTPSTMVTGEETLETSHEAVYRKDSTSLGFGTSKTSHLEESSSLVFTRAIVSAWSAWEDLNYMLASFELVFLMVMLVSLLALTAREICD